MKTFSVSARNEEQKVALRALHDPDIHLVILSGGAGTGKTLLAVSAGLSQADRRKYRGVLVARPTVAVGHDVGFLPGSLEEKLAPWTAPVFDALETILGGSGASEADRLVRDGLLEMEALAFIRGRSIPNKFLIVDEAQNLSRHEVKTILTRAGEGTKIVLTGDPSQIDVPSLTVTTNGLSLAAEAFRGHPLAEVVDLVECERSALAAVAAELL